MAATTPRREDEKLGFGILENVFDGRSHKIIESGVPHSLRSHTALGSWDCNAVHTFFSSLFMTGKGSCPESVLFPNFRMIVSYEYHSF